MLCFLILTNKIKWVDVFVKFPILCKLSYMIVCNGTLHVLCVMFVTFSVCSWVFFGL